MSVSFRAPFGATSPGAKDIRNMFGVQIIGIQMVALFQLGYGMIRSVSLFGLFPSYDYEVFDQPLLAGFHQELDAIHNGEAKPEIP